jgi:hypothetical protein
MFMMEPDREYAAPYPLLAAAEAGDRKRALSLIGSGADVNLRDDNGWSPLIMAAKEGHADLLGSLLESGAIVNPGDDSHTALRGAAMNGRHECVELLLAAAADPNMRSGGGRTPLMGAAMNGHARTVRLLLERGADASARNDASESALELAEANGHAECLGALSATPSPPAVVPSTPAEAPLVPIAFCHPVLPSYIKAGEVDLSVGAAIAPAPAGARTSPLTNGLVVRLVGRCRWRNGPMFKSIFVLLCIPPLTIVLLVWLVCLFRRRAHNYFQYFGLGDAPPLPPELQASDAARAATKHLRFVHISDTHMCHERLGELPAGDVLVHNIAHLSTA